MTPHKSLNLRKLRFIFALMITVGATVALAGTDKHSGNIGDLFISIESESQAYFPKLEEHASNKSYAESLNVERHSMIEDLNELSYVLRTAHPRVKLGDLSDRGLSEAALNQYKARFDAYIDKLEDVSGLESDLQENLEPMGIQLDPIPEKIQFSKIDPEHQTPGL